MAPASSSVLASVIGALMFCVGIPGRASSQNPPSDSIVEQLRLLYDSGFAGIAKMAPDSARLPAFWPLSALARFKVVNVRWARLEGRAYRALERGNRAAGWIAIVPPGHEFLKSRPEVLAMDPNPQLNVVTIKPVDMSEPWAGIFLVNAISHLADRVLGVTPPTATPAQVLLSQFRAYNLELMAADVLSNGAMREALDSVLDLAHESSFQQLAVDAPRLALTNLGLLSSAVPAGEPRSPDERRLRSGFFAMALILRHGQRQALGVDAILPALDEAQRSASGSLSAQSPSKWCEYIPRALEAIIAQHQRIAAQSDFSVTGDQFPSRLTFHYTGVVRRLGAERRDFLGKYFRFLQHPEKADLFTHELQFQGDSGRTYWFLIQEAMLPEFQAEVAPGDSSILFLLWSGVYGPRGGTKDWVFLINEFTSSKSGAYWRDQLATCGREN